MPFPRLAASLLLHVLASGAQAGPVALYIGNYTKGEGAGIYRTTFDEETAAFGTPVLAGKLDSPSFLAVHPMMPRLYAVSEVTQGTVHAFRIREDGELEPLGSQPSGGAGPCHVSVDPSGGVVLVANYGGGSCASFPILADGSLGSAASVHQHAGSSIHPKRQEAPHAHSILPDPSGHRAFVADLGIDRVLIYGLDSGSGELSPNDPPAVPVPAGSGPRHVAFHPQGRFAFVNLELTSGIASFRHDPDTGALSLVETRSTLPSDFEGPNSTAETLVHPNGELVFVSNRGHDSIAVFRIDPASGRLTHLGNQPTGGEVPRNFVISPSGLHLLAANQKSGTIHAFRIDAAQGTLEPTGTSVDAPSPVCVRFFRP
jgi:6-phosphogluconolactonase